MLSLDLFNTKYERELREGAVDDLEARRIDTLNDRMQDLLARAKESNYKNNPAALAGLKREYQKFKDERDSYYKVREAGIPGNIPVEKIPGKEDLLKGKGRSYYEATGDGKFDAMMGKISKDPWTQLNSDPNWEYEIEELVDQHIEPWLLAMEKSGMPITRDEETLNPGWRKRYEQMANKLAQEFLTSRGLNPRDPDLVGKIRYAIDWHTDESKNVHGQLSAYSDLPLQRYADAFDADGQTANMRDAMVGFIRTDDDDDDEPPTRPMPDNDPRRLDPGNMEEAESKLNPNAKCRICGNPYNKHFTFGPDGKIESSNYRHATRPKDFPDLYNIEEAQDETVLDKYKERVGTLGNLQKDNERYQDWRDSHHAVATNFHSNQQRRHDADTDDKIERMAIDRDRLRQNDADWKDTFDMMRDRINRYQWSSQGSVNPKKLKKISSIKYQPTREEAENAISTDAKGRTQQQWIKLVQAKFPTAKIMQAKMIDGPVFATLPDGRKISWKKVETSNNQKKNSALGEKKLGQLRPTLGTGHDVGRSVKKFRTQRGLDEQHNPEDLDDDWYDDQEDQETELRSGDYVRDQMDGESGEIFRMQGDPYERRVRILDRDGKGWYIEPSRLIRVDPADPDVQRYFGKNRQRDMDEGQFSIADDPQAHAKILFLKTINGNEYRLVKQGDAYKIYVNRSRKNKQEFPSFDLAKKALQQLLLNAVHTDEQGVAEGKADYNFDADDLKRLERIRDLPTLKTQALALISRPSAKPMKPEKVEWFKNALDRMNSPIKVIKLMYDLLLSGEGHAVVGSRSSMNPNSYRQRFGEQGVEEGWKSTVGGAALAGAMALGAGGAQARVAGDNVDNPDVNRLTGKPNVAQTVQGDQAKPTAPSGYSKAYLQSVVDGSHPRPMVSKEKAQELLNQLREQGVSEGWSDAMVARRTGGPRTPYSVYIKGRKWKDFENEDHAEAVANKLRAKFKADGRDPSVITIAPTDMTEAQATKTRLDPKCWTGKKIGNPKTKVKGGVRVNNCVPAESVNEDQDTSGVERAILNRIMVAHTDLLMKFGPQKVMQAAEEVAYNVGDVDEIGTSDISAYVRQVMQILGATP